MTGTKRAEVAWSQKECRHEALPTCSARRCSRSRGRVRPGWRWRWRRRRRRRIRWWWYGRRPHVRCCRNRLNICGGRICRHGCQRDERKWVVRDRADREPGKCGDRHHQQPDDRRRGNGPTPRSTRGEWQRAQHGINTGNKYGRHGGPVRRFRRQRAEHCACGRNRKTDDYERTGQRRQDRSREQPGR
ncbi:hypothetical protein ACVI1I_003505 [Bradyrhizobium sp. USDA 4459]